MPTPSDLSPIDDLGYDRPRSRVGTQLFRFKFWARRYWWVIALSIMLGLGIMDLLCLRDTPEYVSQSRMIVNGRVTLPQGEVYNEALELANFFMTQVALMKSPQTMHQAIDRVSAMHPEIPLDSDAQVDAGLELR